MATEKESIISRNFIQDFTHVVANGPTSEHTQASLSRFSVLKTKHTKLEGKRDWGHGQNRTGENERWI